MLKSQLSDSALKWREVRGVAFNNHNLKSSPLPIGSKVTNINPIVPLVATTEYIVGTTHITNGYSLVNSVLLETPHFKPVTLWDNQLDVKPPEQPVPAPAAGRPHPR